MLKDFDTYDFTALPTLNKPKILELAAANGLTQHCNCCLVGSSERAKRIWRSALGLAACRQGKRVRFFTAAALVNALEEAQKQYRLDRFLGQLDTRRSADLRRAGLPARSAGGGAELLFQVFADRYERKSLLLTSNLPFSEWGQIFQGERMTAALLDRLDTPLPHLRDEW